LDPRIKKPSLLKLIVTEKCPRCGKGRVFEPRKGLLKFPVMKDECSECGYRFNREPGYFLGAMYVSYGLAVAEAVATFLICYFLFPQLPLIWYPVFITITVVLLSYRNFRLSRIIYMHIFPW
jgi:uncharacterized protein (DUF983 family)